MEKIRICKIQVTKLFGNISYDIDLNVDDPIAIITAPNGCGKTTLLNLISFILNPAYDVFEKIRTIPFEVFRCVLSNDKTVELRQVKNSSGAHSKKAKNSLTYMEKAALRLRAYFDNTDFVFCIYDSNNAILHELVFSKAFSEAFEMDPAEYLDETDEDFPYARGQHASLSARLKYIWNMQKEILIEESCNFPVNYIKADRIQPVQVPDERFDEPRPVSPLKIASESIVKYIKDATERYSEAVSHAKDKLPQMFLDGEGSGLGYEEFMEGWSVYREELDQFQKIGLIMPTEDFTKGKDISKVYNKKGEFLSTYLSAFKDTTAPLKDTFERIDLFKQILDERNAITGKTVRFGREGISLFSRGRRISLDTLSSGEKHDFIMFYNLIFNISDNGLVLIDEPEISLHIEWQETYLDKLIAICEMNSLQAIIATHSPNIVSSHYDFLVDKGETYGQD